MVVPGQINRRCSGEAHGSAAHASALSALRKSNRTQAGFPRQPDWFSGGERLVLWMVTQTSVGQRCSMGGFLRPWPQPLLCQHLRSSAGSVADTVGRT